MYFTASGDRNIKEGFTIVGRAESADGNSWRVNPKDPVIVGDENSWDRSIETVSLLWNEKVQRWDMWYLGWKSNLKDQPGIGHMRSKDREGKLWEREEEPIYRPAEDAWDDGIVSGPSVMIGPDGIYRMYYAGIHKTMREMGIGLPGRQHPLPAENAVP